MARIDNLSNFCVDIADAIREKKGTTENLTISEFDNEIRSLKTGGDSLEEFMRMIDTVVSCAICPTRVFSEKDYTEQELQETQKLLDRLGSDMNG